MSNIINDILCMLNDDMVSHGLLAQCVQQATDGGPLQRQLQNVLEEILTFNAVEIGITKANTPEYVEFIAWTGSVPGRVKRAMEAVASANGADKEFAYWLCLRKNVDHFEDEQPPHG